MYASHPLNVTGRILARILSRTLHFLLPHCCLACRDPVPLFDEAPIDQARGDAVSSPTNLPPNLPRLGLCPPCRSRLSPWPETPCRDRGTDDAPSPQDACLAVWSYRDPIDSVLMALKFRRLQYLAPPLGRYAATHFAPRLTHIDGVVPVPLHWRRRWRRGFDQAELLARSVAKTLGCPLRHALRRRRATGAQSRRSRRHRETNVREAFSLKSGFVTGRGSLRDQHVLDQHILLVDDVMTTGATLKAAADALKPARPASVTALTMARTPMEAAESADGADTEPLGGRRSVSLRQHRT